MAPHSNNDFTFIAVTVAGVDRVFLLAEPDNKAALGVGFGWGNGKITGQNQYDFAPLRADWVPGIVHTIVGVEGEALTTRAGGVVSSVVLDAGPNGPGGRGWIRDARRIDGRLYAVGMSRQAYMRDDDYAWHHIDADILSKPGEIVGFNGIDGFSSKEIYAVGLPGEIWRYTGSRWFSVPSPTNVQLNAVRCIGEHVYIVGGSGVVLRGRMDRFELLTVERDEPNLDAVEGFGETVYVASLRKLYALKGTSLREVSTGLGEITAGSLSSGDGVLWSVGAKHLIWTDDGKKWNQVFV
jgi:hypothetical protein